MSAAPSKLVRNERVKLRATALNSVAVTSVAAGFVTPVAAISFGIGSSARSAFGATLAACAWLAIGLLLHYLATRVLGGLEE